MIRPYGGIKICPVCMLIPLGSTISMWECQKIYCINLFVSLMGSQLFLPRIPLSFIWKQPPDLSLEDHPSPFTGHVVEMGLNPSDLEVGVGLCLANWEVHPGPQWLVEGWVQYTNGFSEDRFWGFAGTLGCRLPAVFKLAECPGLLVEATPCGKPL